MTKQIFICLGILFCLNMQSQKLVEIKQVVITKGDIIQQNVVLPNSAVIGSPNTQVITSVIDKPNIDKPNTQANAVVIDRPIIEVNAPGKPIYTPTPIVNREINWVIPSSSTVSIGKTGNLLKPAASIGFDNGLVYSRDTVFVNDSAWINFTVTDLVSQFLLGFASLENSGADRANHKIYILQNQIYIIETDGDGFYNKKLIGTVNVNDQFKITVYNTKIEYYKNGQKIFTSKLLSGGIYLYEGNIHTLSTGIANVTGSKGIVN